MKIKKHAGLREKVLVLSHHAVYCVADVALRAALETEQIRHQDMHACDVSMQVFLSSGSTQSILCRGPLKVWLNLYQTTISADCFT